MDLERKGGGEELRGVEGGRGERESVIRIYYTRKQSNFNNNHSHISMSWHKEKKPNNPDIKDTIPAVTRYPRPNRVLISCRTYICHRGERG